MAVSNRLVLLLVFSLSVLQVTARISTSYGLYNRQVCRGPNDKVTICSRDFRCSYGKCVPRRPPPQNPCLVPDATVCRTPAGLLCCAADQRCGNNQCIDKFPEPDTCEAGTTLCNNIDGASCCIDGQQCINGICTNSAFCLPQTKTCFTPVGLLCCGLNQTCGDNQCIDNNPGPVCVAPETPCSAIDGSRCCTADQVCQAGVCVAT